MEYPYFIERSTTQGRAGYAGIESAAEDYNNFPDRFERRMRVEEGGWSRSNDFLLIARAS